VPPSLPNLKLPPVSVIICARNEAHHLPIHLPKILSQDYPNYEVIVVNDRSTDQSLAILQNLAQQHSHLKIINIQTTHNQLKGKKNALDQGINNATHNYLLMTDADCYPASNQWIQQMVRNFSEEKKIILGYGPYLVKNSFLNKCIQYETFQTAINYLSFATISKPYMGVGRNLAYVKSLYKKGAGFESHKELLSGDDDLFINQFASTRNTTIEISPQSFCYSIPPMSWRAWYRQKRRHLTTGSHYKREYQFYLALLSLSHFGFYVSLIALLVLGYSGTMIIIVYLFKIGIQLFYARFLSKKLNLTNILPYTPLLDFLMIVYYVIFFPYLFTCKSIPWK